MGWGRVSFLSGDTVPFRHNPALPKVLLTNNRGSRQKGQRLALMKVYVLKGPVSVYVYSTLYETRDFFLVPQDDGGFSVFSKSVFILSIEEALAPGSPEAVGFASGK